MSLIKLIVCGLLFGVSLSAQNPVVNPTTVIFDDPDFAQTQSYSIGYFSTATATTPVQEATMAKPSSCTPCAGPLPSRPANYQTWWVRVKSQTGTSVTSAWSDPVPFVRAPATPTNVSLK